MPNNKPSPQIPLSTSGSEIIRFQTPILLIVLITLIAAAFLILSTKLYTDTAELKYDDLKQTATKSQPATKKLKYETKAWNSLAFDLPKQSAILQSDQNTFKAIQNTSFFNPTHASRSAAKLEFCNANETDCDAGFQITIKTFTKNDEAALKNVDARLSQTEIPGVMQVLTYETTPINDFVIELETGKKFYASFDGSATVKRENPELTLDDVYPLKEVVDEFIRTLKKTEYVAIANTLYTNPEKTYRISFPDTWKQEDLNGVTFKSQDDISFNINPATAFGLEGYQTIDEETYTNPNGVIFQIGRYKPDEDPVWNLDKNIRLNLVNSDLLGEIIFYNYNAAKNPNAEKTLKEILDGVEPIR